MNDDSAYPRTFSLRDGVEVSVRPLGPDDRDHLVRGFGELSARSRYLRFLGPVKQLTERQLDVLTDVDGVDRAAFIFEIYERGELVGGGVARYARLDDEPAAAELALTVTDAFQGLGLGTLMLRILIDAARGNGLRRLVGFVAPYNERMLRILRRAGATFARDGQLLRVEIALEES